MNCEVKLLKLISSILVNAFAWAKCMIIIIIMAVTSDEINFLDRLCNIFHILYVSPLNRSLRYFSSFSEFPL